MASAWWAGLHATDLVEVVDLADRPDALDRGGWWSVVVEFEGRARAWRFATVRPAPLPPAPSYRGPSRRSWVSSMTREQYVAGVDTIRDLIRDGEVYQVNLCRVLSAVAPAGVGDTAAGGCDPYALAARLAAGNPAPYSGVLDAGDEWFVSASPELYLGREGDVVRSGPIKGTARTPAGLTDKDRAENLMITDLVRNDLQRVCRPGTVEVTSLLRTERHPGLAHLVSTVQGRLRPGAGWGDLLTATFPPGSVSGAPKSTALRAIGVLEPVPRGPYCGAVGFVDADRDVASLAVGIRTFWAERGLLRFGTGAGITWGSDAAAEWAETELKAERLVALASAPDAPSGAGGTIGA